MTYLVVKNAFSQTVGTGTETTFSVCDIFVNFSETTKQIAEKLKHLAAVLEDYL
jgi:hypothetical protein